VSGTGAKNKAERARKPDERERSGCGAGARDLKKYGGKGAGAGGGVSGSNFESGDIKQCCERSQQNFLFLFFTCVILGYVSRK